MIRLSTKTIFEQGLFNPQRSQAEVFGRRTRSPAAARTHAGG